MKRLLIAALLCALASLNADARNARGGAPPFNMPSVAGLHVANSNQILNGSGQPLQLRGVDKSGSEYICVTSAGVFDGPSDSASVTVLGTWAINVVRIPLNEDCWLNINGVVTGGSSYITPIVNYVNLLTAANIAVILELHWSAPGTTLANGQVPMPDVDHSSTFWASVAGTFNSNSSVIYDLFNEPFPDSNQDTVAAWTCLKSGGNNTNCPGNGLTWTNGAVGMQSLITTIRGTGSTNIIMIGCVQFAEQCDSWTANLPTDTLVPAQLAASWHSYNTSVCNTQSCWTSQMHPIMASYPLIVGEIGENDCADTYVTNLMTDLDVHGGNYLGWAWDTYNCSSFPALISNYNGTPTAFGIGLQNHFLSQAGRQP